MPPGDSPSTSAQHRADDREAASGIGDAEHDDEQRRAAAASAAARGDQAHLEQEQREDALEQVEEQRLDRCGALRAR